MREEGEGGVATPISFSIFDSYDMKSSLLASNGKTLKLEVFNFIS